MYAFKILVLLIFVTALNAQDKVGKYALADSITPQKYKAWDISVFPDGKNAPKGEGNYQSGKKLFAQKCAYCHGKDGEGGIKLDKYRGAIATLVKKDGDSLTSEKPHKNIGTYWQYATVLFEYIRRTMPYENPKSLSNNEVYSLTTYLLAENKIISKKQVLNQDNLAKVKMPNVDGFICDNRIDTKSVACMKDCPLPSEKDYNKGIVIDNTDYLRSDCLIQSEFDK